MDGGQFMQMKIHLY